MRTLFRLFIFTMPLWAAGIALAGPDLKAFTWPRGKAWALSLSFDDARDSQLKTGIPLFEREGVQVTFYVLPGPLEWHHEGWKGAVSKGHEIGNHTVNHPCTGNFDWVKEENAMENYTLERMRAELYEANRKIEQSLGTKPVSFAYTCGETAVGRGVQSKSYIPIVADLFISGRGWLGEAANNPLKVDLAHVLGMKMDDTSFSSLKPILDAARDKGYWVVLVGHEISRSGEEKPGEQTYTTRVELLEELIDYAKKPENAVWLAPVGTVAAFIDQKRKYSNPRTSN